MKGVSRLVILKDRSRRALLGMLGKSNRSVVSAASSGVDETQPTTPENAQNLEHGHDDESSAASSSLPGQVQLVSGQASSFEEHDDPSKDKEDDADERRMAGSSSTPSLPPINAPTGGVDLQQEAEAMLAAPAPSDSPGARSEGSAGASRRPPKLALAMGKALNGSPGLGDAAAGGGDGRASFASVVSAQAVQPSVSSTSPSKFQSERSLGSRASSRGSLSMMHSRRGTMQQFNAPPTPQSRATSLADILSDELIDVGTVRLDSVQRSLCELLARNYHETWSLEQMKKGVVHGDGRPIVKIIKSQAGKRGARQERHATTRVEVQTSALLRPFELLPPEDQRGNRSQAEELVKAVVAMGYRIVPQNQLAQELEEAEHNEIRQLEVDE